MSWSDSEESRIAALETLLNKVQIAVTNLAAKQQLRQLTLLKQNEVDALTTRIEALERMVTLLENAL
jgi:polyhydroxyalkanoate synthesis regulator phasin